uniref:Phosphorylated adapter RNA export protein n=1 Tax=Steinernema glaseri TaxID=37863 RepID=A0A1I7Y211_9BILA
MSGFRNVAAHGDSSDGELSSSGDEAVPLPPPKAEEPKSKRIRSIWTDVALEQSLDFVGRQVNVTGSQECKINRGAESYSAIKKPLRGALVAEFDKAEDPSAVQDSDDLFGDVAEVEEFGVGGRNRLKIPTEYSAETSRVFRGRGRGGTAYKRKSPTGRTSPSSSGFKKDGSSSNSSSRDSSLSRRGRGGARGGLQSSRGKRKYGSNNNLPLLPKGYSIEKLVSAEFEPGMSVESLTEQACEAMGETKKEMIAEVIAEIGEEKFHEIFNKVRETEINGGMMTALKDRRKTPGGVFMHFFRIDPSISQEFKDKILSVDFNFARRFIKAKKNNQNNARPATPQDDSQPVLKSAAEVYLNSAPAAEEEGEIMDES